MSANAAKIKANASAKQQQWMKERALAKQASANCPPASAVTGGAEESLYPSPQPTVAQLYTYAPPDAAAIAAERAALEAGSNAGIEKRIAAERAEQLEVRASVMKEEVKDIGEDIVGCRQRLAAEQAELALLHAADQTVESEVAKYMENVRKRKHDIALRRAEREEACRVILLEETQLNERLTMTSQTLEALECQLSGTTR